MSFISSNKLFSYQNNIFDEISVSKLPLSSVLYNKFKTDTMNAKNYAGFPTKKGFRKGSFPITTQNPPDHPTISQMFDQFFSKNKEYLNDCIEKEIEQRIEKEKSNTPESTVGSSTNTDDSDDETVEQNLVNGDRKRILTQDNNINTGSFNKKTKTSKESSTKLEEIPLLKDLTKQYVLSIKREIKDSVIKDEETKVKEMTHSSAMLVKVIYSIEKWEPAVEQELLEIETERKTLLQRLEEKEKFVKDEFLCHIAALKGIEEDLKDYIKAKAEEYMKLEIEEEEELDQFFSQKLKKKANNLEKSE